MPIKVTNKRVKKTTVKKHNKKAKGYTHYSEAETDRLYLLQKGGKSPSQVAELLGAACPQ